MKRCPTQDQLRDWLAGLASDADSLTIEKHVAGCTEICQPLLDRMSGFEDGPRGSSGQRPGADETPATVAQQFSTPAAFEASSAPRRPNKFGRFVILEQLGKGGFGTVYRAHDPQLDREVALKIPSKGLLQTDDERKRFLREARAAATLQHANICPVYEAGELAGRQFIVMALIDGQSLAKVIARGRPLAERAAVSTVRKLALALEEAHRAGIIHRDLKPTNIMIDRRGNPVVMDFGLARRCDPDEATLTQVGAVLGTPAYMAPEQALSQHDEIGPATDIFALGIVLYELLTLRRPFAGGGTALVEAKPPSAVRTGLDPRLDAICLKAIAKNPSDRYHSMRELAEALREYLKGADAGPADMPPLVETQELNALFSGLDARLHNIAKRQRVPWWQWTAAVFALAGIVFLGWLAFPRGSSTVMVRIGIDPELLADDSLTFFLDQREITSQQAADELPLAVGDHDLLVKRALKIVTHYRFHVSAKPDPSDVDSGPSDNQLVVLTEVNDGAETAVELPAPVAYLSFDDEKETSAAGADAGRAPPPGGGGNRSRRPGVAGPAASFSRPEDAITLADNPRFHSNTAFTIAVWACPKTDRPARIAGRWSEKNAFLLSWADGMYSFSVAFPVGGPNGTSVGVQAFGVPGSWTLVTGVYDGERLRLYIDGQLTNSQPLSRSAALHKTPEFARDGKVPTTVQESSGPFEIGADGFDGLIDEVKFWDLALSEEQAASLFAAYNPPPPPRFADLKLLVPAYFYPGGEGQKEWDKLIAAASDVSIVAVANPSSGPGNAADPNYAAVIHQSTQAGVRVIGYVATSFGNRTVAEVTADIDRWLRFYPEIGGFFFDEQASGADQVDHYAELYQYAKRKPAEGLVVGNPGVACDRGFFERPAADVICIFDNKTGLRGFQSPVELNRISPGRLAAVLYDVPNAEQMRSELDHAATHGIEYIYLTDDTGANPWDRLPSYWQEEVAAMHAH